MIVPTFVAVTFLSFLLIHLVPGDPIEARSGQRGIRRSVWPNCAMSMASTGRCGVSSCSMSNRWRAATLARRWSPMQSVWREFLQLFPATVELSICAILFAVLIGLPLGVIAAVRRGTVFDYGLIGVSVTGSSMPIFWWGLMLILFFSVTLGWTPVSGRIAILLHRAGHRLHADRQLVFRRSRRLPSRRCRHLVLPAIVLGTIPLAVVARMTRSAMLEVLNEDYIRTARAKGLCDAARRHRARAAQRADPGGHRDRPAGRLSARRARS